MVPGPRCAGWMAAFSVPDCRNAVEATYPIKIHFNPNPQRVDDSSLNIAVVAIVHRQPPPSSQRYLPVGVAPVLAEQTGRRPEFERRILRCLGIERDAEPRLGRKREAGPLDLQSFGEEVSSTINVVQLLYSRLAKLLIDAAR